MAIYRPITTFVCASFIAASVLLLTLLKTPALAQGFNPSDGSITDTRWGTGIPLGGIGDGKIELLSDGGFGNFTNHHNWDNPTGFEKAAFAAIRVSTPGEPAVSRLLRLSGPGEYADVTNIAHTKMTGLFPRGFVTFSDQALPVLVKLAAFSPLVPHDIKDSSLPVVALDYTIVNTAKKPEQISLLLSWPNLIGLGGTGYDNLAGDTQTPFRIGDLNGLHYTTTQKYNDIRDLPIGDEYIAAKAQTGQTITTEPDWDSSALTPSFWQTFTETGLVSDNHASPSVAPAGAVDSSLLLAPGQSRTVRFYVVWAMPHLETQQTVSTLVPIAQTDPKTDRWTTSAPQMAGDNLTVDLGADVSVSKLTIDLGPSPTDYPRGLSVEISSDQTHWAKLASLTTNQVISTVVGNQEVTDLSPGTGRYLRLTDLGSDNYYWWSICKLTVAANGAPQPLVFGPGDLAGNPVVVGHYWQNGFSDAPHIAFYFDQHEGSLLTQTVAWQTPVLNSSLPFWLKFKMINGAFTMFANTVLTKDGRFAILESPVDMYGSLGTMDQRIAAHAFYTDFFPELDRADLELFAQCQRPDGSITHFNGNVHDVIGDPRVTYGITGWPDLTTGWVGQVVKLYRLTGDTGFLNRMQPHVTRAMSWLAVDGKNSNGIPAGGSSFDYGQGANGEFVYSAILYLASLRAASSIASPAEEAHYNAVFNTTQKTVLSDLWNGEYFRTFKDPATGAVDQDSFVNSEAGDWLTRLSGLPSTLPAHVSHTDIASNIERHQKPFFPVTPSEVTPDGKVVQATSYCLQLEPFVGCEAIYENYVDDGINTIYRNYYLQWLTPSHPAWGMRLGFRVGSDTNFLAYYVTNPTTWFALNALTGASLDVPSGALTISPRLSTKQTELHLPIYFPRFWAWLDYVPSKHILKLRINKTFNPSYAAQATLYHVGGVPGDSEPATIVIKTVAADGSAKSIRLKAPFTVTTGTTLDLSPYIKALAPSSKSELVPGADQLK